LIYCLRIMSVGSGTVAVKLYLISSAPLPPTKRNTVSRATTFPRSTDCPISTHTQKKLHLLPLSFSNNYFTYILNKQKSKGKEMFYWHLTKFFHTSHPLLRYSSILRSQRPTMFKIISGSTGVPMSHVIIRFDQSPI
jgi:hypothetical protein